MPSKVSFVDGMTYGVEQFILVRSRNFEGVTGIGKHFSVGDNRVISAEMHPRSGIQSLYDDGGKELVR